MENAMQRGGNGALGTLNGFLTARRANLAEVLPKHMSPDRMLKIAISAASRNPKLLECSPESFYTALHTSSQLGLEPNTPLGHGYLIPYFNKHTGKMEAQFQSGYKGIADLAMRDGRVASIDCYCVYSCDEFDVLFGLHPKLEHRPILDATTYGDEDEIKAFYAVAHFTNGSEPKFCVMTRRQMDQHRDKYCLRKGNVNEFWQRNYVSMALKTVVKQLCKLLPQSVQLAEAIAADNEIESEEEPMQTAVAVSESAPPTRTEGLKQKLLQQKQNDPAAETSSEQEAEVPENPPAKRGRPRKTPEASPPQPMDAPIPAVTTAPAAPVDDLHTENITFLEWIDIGMNQVKFIDNHNNAYYSGNILIAEPLKKAIDDGIFIRCVTWHTVNGRAMIVAANV